MKTNNNQIHSHLDSYNINLSSMANFNVHNVNPKDIQRVHASFFEQKNYYPMIKDGKLTQEEIDFLENITKRKFDYITDITSSRLIELKYIIFEELESRLHRGTINSRRYIRGLMRRLHKFFDDRKEERRILHMNEWNNLPEKQIAEDTPLVREQTNITL